MTPKSEPIKTLSNIARILQKSAPAENPLAHIVALVREQMNVDICSLYLLQDKTLILVATNGLDPASIGKVRMKVQEGLTGLAVEQLQPVIVNEASLHPRFKFFPETGEEKFHSFAAIPLFERDKVVGVLTVQTKLPRDFATSEIELLKLIAFQLSPVIHNLVTLEVLQIEEREAKKSFQFKGIGVAPGFGIGPAFFLRTKSSDLLLSREKRGQLHPKEEWKKLAIAIQKASFDLLTLEKKLRKKFSKKESDIFYSHRMILSDPSFLKKLKSETQKGKSALEAIVSLIDEYILQFQKIEDPHFRERSADLEDLKERVLEHLIEEKPKKKSENWNGILIAETLVPSDAAKLDAKKISGIVTLRGGATSHAAILARSLGIPAVMGVSGLFSKVQPGDLVMIDGNKGEVYVNPERSVLRDYEKTQEAYADQIVHLQRLAIEPAKTVDERRIHLDANVGFLTDLKKLRYFGAEGVGLYRTEFPFMMRKSIPSEQEQFELYRKIIEEVDGLMLTFRILDAGGDKPIESFGIAGGKVREANPFLGYRSIRLSLSQPEILKTQFRALLRASALGKIRIMIPMISGMEELRAVKQIYEEVKKDLTKQKIKFDPQVPFGIMIEVPSAVSLAHLLIHEADFLSIGTNDLIQYTLAVDRNNERVASFFEPLHPAILSSIAQVARAGLQANKTVGICGEMAGDPNLTALLVGLGITQLSMIASNIPLVKKIILQLQYSDVRKMASDVLQVGTIEEVKKLLRPFRKFL